MSTPRDLAIDALSDAAERLCANLHRRRKQQPEQFSQQDHMELVEAEAAIAALAAVPVQEPVAQFVDPTPEQMAALGWQMIVCDICGHSARAFPKPAEVAKAEPMAMQEGIRSMFDHESTYEFRDMEEYARALEGALIVAKGTAESALQWKRPAALPAPVVPPDAEQLILAAGEFRDAVLYQRKQLEAPCLDNDQTNAVLNLFDDYFPMLFEPAAPLPGESV